jgi:queuine tRNA-ribosyltransferase
VTERALAMEVHATDGAARSGTLHTARGTITTPCFMPVGTRGAVRTLAADDLDQLGAQVVLGNTYHLMLRPGTEVIEQLGGLHRFMGWDGHLLTDSGGFQIFSLEAPSTVGRSGGAKVDDDGVTFRSTYDGDLHRLTPEGAVDVQLRLGADIQMVLDVCPPLPSPPEVVQLAVQRTAAWAAKARTAFLASDGPARGLAQMGIVQGGVDLRLRAESAARTLEVGFDGYALGGLSVGEDRAAMLDVLDATVPLLPADQPRYLMGVGDPVGLIEAIARGIDLFDCVLPTRYGRHGTVLTRAGRYNLRNAANAADDGPLDEACPCAVCARWSRGYLRHLLQVGEPTAARLLTRHNVAWTLALVAEAREAVEAGRIQSMRSDIAAAWE